MAHWPDHLDPVEARICNRLITAIFARDYLIQVREGEMHEVMCPPTTNRADIQAMVAATGITLIDLIQVVKQKPTRVGVFALIHGNGEDVISEFSWHPQVPELEEMMEALFEQAIAVPTPG